MCLPPPDLLRDLLDKNDADSRFYKQKIRSFNSNLAYASLQAETADLGRGLQVFKMHGESYHRIGNILPSYKPKHADVGDEQNAQDKQKESNAKPQFLALYFYDHEIDGENEVDMRASGALATEQDKRIMSKLQDMINRIVFSTRS